MAHSQKPQRDRAVRRKVADTPAPRHGRILRGQPLGTAPITPVPRRTRSIAAGAMSDAPTNGHHQLVQELFSFAVPQVPTPNATSGGAPPSDPPSTSVTMEPSALAARDSSGSSAMPNLFAAPAPPALAARDSSDSSAMSNLFAAPAPSARSECRVATGDPADPDDPDNSNNTEDLDDEGEDGDDNNLEILTDTTKRYSIFLSIKSLHSSCLVRIPTSILLRKGKFIGRAFDPWVPPEQIFLKGTPHLNDSEEMLNELAVDDHLYAFRLFDCFLLSHFALVLSYALIASRPSFRKARFCLIASLLRVSRIANSSSIG